MAEKLLIFIPTYNEHENVGRLLDDILALGLDADLLFMDDHSPDGTGRILDELAASHSRMRVLHRSGKLGIGSAHQDGIRYAYENGYDKLLTMDCDFTHSPSDIPRLLESSVGSDVTLGSRFMEGGGLQGWTMMRRFLTWLGHFLTRMCLNLSVDATGAFRVYDLRRISHDLFDVVTSRSYSFFFESLFVLSRNGRHIKEIPILLPARTYGHSKMSLREAAHSARLLLRLWIEYKINPGRFRPGVKVAIDPTLVDPQNWDPYWAKKREWSSFIYEQIASIYRCMFIKRNLEGSLRRNFPPSSMLLHAGCGSGQVDQNLHHRYGITAVDISPQALYLYSQHNPAAREIRHANILRLPFPDAAFDGAYNLGVVEHFSHDEIRAILRELRRVVRPGGRVVIFWPHRRATSVFVLKIVHHLFRKFIDPDKAFHPPEPSLTSGQRETASILRGAGLEPVSYLFGASDLYIQAVVVGRRSPDSVVAAPTEPAEPAPLRPRRPSVRPRQTSATTA